MNTNLNFEQSGKAVAVIKNKDTKIKDKTIYLSNDDDVRAPYDMIEATKNEKISLITPTKDSRVVLYVVGMSGSGKSYWSANYIKEYQKKNPNNKVFIISPIYDDESINSIKNLERINPNSENFLNEPPPLSYFKDGLIICDDIEAYGKKTLNRVMALINAVLTTGRHMNIQFIVS
jgi:chromosomal replication initiation ATPase DnaA